MTMENSRQDFLFGSVFSRQKRDIQTKQPENALFLFLAGLSQTFEEGEACLDTLCSSRGASWWVETLVTQTSYP